MGETDLASLYTKRQGLTSVDSIEITQLSVIDLD
jgi:hypothetical protein